jgi:hypothetical protein
MWGILTMMLLVLLGLVPVLLTVMWWAGRDIKPNRNGPQENVAEVMREDR